MPPIQQHSRINVQALKAQMVKRIGPERAKQYFNHFKGYISLRFNKTELDKLVVLTIGKENIGLHNEIIKAVLSNAIKSETRPFVQDMSKPGKGVHKKLLQCVTSNDAARGPESPAAGTTPLLSNGDICAESTREERLGALDQTTLKDEGNLLGKHIDGKSCLVDLHRPFKHIEGAAEQSYADPSDGSVRLGKRPRIIVPPSPDLDISKTSFEQLSSSGAANLRHDDAYRQQWESGFIRSALGTPFYSNNVGSMAKLLPFFRLAGSFPQLPPVKGADEEFVYSNDLPSKELLQRQMEHIAELEGLEGVNEDCAEILNQGIDTFLKRLIGACIDLVKSRSLPQQQGSQQADRQVRSCLANLSSAKKVNQLSGSEPSSSGTQKELMQKEEDLFQPTVSFVDFKVAMDLNPQQLGQDWPLQLEKIHLYSFD
eukprot:c20111_g1_i1 orf=1065-2348(+)